jgi:type IX secretion system PorP/SprF family membrane protein
MKKILVFAGMLILVNLSFAQDIHFSQFYETQLYLNPSSSGVFNGDQRVIANYRNQWPSISGIYKTYLLSFDTKLFQKRKLSNNYMGLGLVVFNDQSDGARLSTLQANISLSYHVLINEQNYLSAGIQGGYAQRSINNSALQWDNQYDGDDYNQSLASGEPSIMFSNFSYGDFGAGVLWNYFSKDKNVFSNNVGFGANIGASVFHINRPEQSFYGNKDKLNPKLVIYGETSFGTRDANMSLLPAATFITQGPLTEVVFGSKIRYMTEGSRYTSFIKQSALSLGAYCRLKDAFIFAIEYEYSYFALGISYDLNISNLTEVTEGKGGMEISLRFINPNPMKRSIRFYR